MILPPENCICIRQPLKLARGELHEGRFDAVKMVILVFAFDLAFRRIKLFVWAWMRE